MKHLILFIAILTIANFAIAQNTEINKSYFNYAKQDIENMLNGKEQPNYEKAIFLIENAYYENNIDENSFELVLQNHVEYINKIIISNYDFNSTNLKPNLLKSTEQLEQQYKQALTNWAIYSYITSNVNFLDSNVLSCHKKYNYSFADPMASNNWTNSQVINLINTHQGNCFALASLFKILSNRLNSDAKLCTAPSHIYINHKDNKGISYNVELGSKNFVGTGTLSTLTHSTMESIKNNIALRELDEKQSVALCLVYLAKGYEHKFNNTTDDFILQCAETTIKYDDKNLNALLLKAEYLETKLTAQHKTIAQLQPQKEFKEYQTLIANLYNLGYKEIPLKMKNQLIKGWSKDTITKLANVAYASSEANMTKLLQARQASLSWGLFDENFSNKPTERISNTIFNTKTKKITSFAKDQNLYNNYNFDPVVFAWNIDPLAHKYPSLSPYSFVANNPMIFTDQTGAFIVGMDGKPVFMEKINGKLQLSANASADTKRVGTAMLVTKTGTKVLKQMLATKHEITITIDNDNKPADGSYANTNPTYDKKTGKLLKSDITFFTKQMEDVIESPSQATDGPQTSKQKKNNFNVDDMLGVNGTHEGTHASDPKALIVQKDIKDGRYGDPSGERAYEKGEEITRPITMKDIDERIIEKKKSR